MPAGDTTLFHRHTEDTVYVVLNETEAVIAQNQLVSQGKVQEPLELELSRGMCICYYMRERKEEFIHRLHLPNDAKVMSRFAGLHALQ